MAEQTGVRVVVDNDNLIAARVGEENTIKVISSVTSEPLSQTLTTMEDVNITNDGPFLLYNDSSSKWESTNIIDCGTY